MTDLVLGYLPGGTGIIEPFGSIFKGPARNVLKDGIEGVDALVFWGGTDIHPSYYGQKPNVKSQQYNMPRPISRDVAEHKAMVYAAVHGIPMIGVCRGAQFLCAFAGGSLIQHVENHHHNHLVKTFDGKIMSTSSCHHQMMYPFDIPHEILAYSWKNRSTVYEGEREEGTFKSYDVSDAMYGKYEPEVVYFPKINSIGIQGHPEWMKEDDEFVQWCLKMVEEKLLNKDKDEDNQLSETTAHSDCEAC